MVRGIIIPADNSASLTAASLETLEDYQRAVGGWIEAVDIPNLAVTMYVNEEGLIRSLLYNRRATLLWRFHVPQARDARLFGDVAMVGLTDDEGENTEQPRDLWKRLLGPGIYRVSTRELGTNRWHEEPIDRDDYVETVVWVALLQEVHPTLEVRIERVDCVESESIQP